MGGKFATQTAPVNARERAHVHGNVAALRWDVGVSLKELLNKGGPLSRFCSSDSGLYARAMRVVVGVDVYLLRESGSGVV